MNVHDQVRVGHLFIEQRELTDILDELEEGTKCFRVNKRNEIAVTRATIWCIPGKRYRDLWISAGVNKGYETQLRDPTPNDVGN